jgi:hypothetical protein
MFFAGSALLLDMLRSEMVWESVQCTGDVPQLCTVERVTNLVGHGPQSQHVAVSGVT